MGQKNIVVYFRKKQGGKDPFADWGKKRGIYHLLFRKGFERGWNMYFCTGPENYLGDRGFSDPYLYDGDSFVFQEGITIRADAVYDRSGGLHFPPEDISSRVLNARSFKLLCADKNQTYDLLREFMPKNFSIKNRDELERALENFSATDLAVLKPANDFGGKGILIEHPDVLKTARIEPGASYALQEFVDTSEGIPGIVSGHHDLRIVIVEGKAVLSHVRTPKPGSLLANVAQGGSIREVPLGNIPRTVLDTVRRIQNIIDQRFSLPLYSIDFGVSGDTPYVFELNDQIGFPSEEMRGAETFIDRLLLSLERLSRS